MYQKKVKILRGFSQINDVCTNLSLKKSVMVIGSHYSMRYVELSLVMDD